MILNKAPKVKLVFSKFLLTISKICYCALPKTDSFGVAIANTLPTDFVFFKKLQKLEIITNSKSSPGLAPA